MSKKPLNSLEDIARLAHVSTSTVSRALNDSPLISQETKKRIQAIAQEHQFQLNIAARNLRRQQSQTIGFVAPVGPPSVFSAEDLFGLGMLSGIGKGLYALGYDLLVLYADPDETTWAQAYLDSGRVDGFILLTSNHKPAVIKSLVEKEIPFIGWGVPIPGLSYSSVTGDNRTGGRLATQHLIDRGRKKIAFLGGPEESLTIQHRFEAYASALQEAGLPVDPTLQAYTDYAYESGVAAMQRLLKQSQDLEAVFVTSDLMAVAAINVIQKFGKRVPEDIAVVGYDDLPIAVYNNLPLTTIRQNFQLVGQLLAENLILYLQTGEVTHVTTPVELVVRQSA